MVKTIIIDGREVPFKASAAVPRVYRIKFKRDVFQDLNALKNEIDKQNKGSSQLSIESLEMFENIAYVMAKQADKENVPDNPDDWFDQFGTFSIYQILPEIIQLWSENAATQADAKKNIGKLTAR